MQQLRLYIKVKCITVYALFACCNEFWIANYADEYVLTVHVCIYSQGTGTEKDMRNLPAELNAGHTLKQHQLDWDV